jgi:peptide/nickel transport system permease protein
VNRSRRWYLIAGGIMVATILFIAIFADHLTTVSPYYADAKLSIMQGTPPFPPSQVHPLGTDAFGRDVWARIAFGARWSLLFAFLIMGARMLLAVPMAIASAFGPRFIGWLTGRLYVYTSAIPPLLIYLLVLSLPTKLHIGLWPSIIIAITLMTLVEWPRIALVLKGRLEELSTEQFVEGAIAVGASPWRIFWVHLMPHLWPTLLNIVVAEIGRGLLIIAQLGIFGVLMGGGIQDSMETATGSTLLITTTGIPEWATLLSDARNSLFQAPWLPISAATAFFLGIVGFNLLSQGLEGLTFSMERVKARTTGRLSAHWRWAMVIVSVGLLLWHFNGLPWGREQGIQALAQRQMDALNRGDLPSYLATIPADRATYRNEQNQWLSQFITGDQQVVMINPSGLSLNGDQATGIWNVSLGYRDRPPVSTSFSVHLVRRLGRWYNDGEAFTSMRGIHTDLLAYFDPVDPSFDAIGKRFNVVTIAQTADQAYEQVNNIFPASAVAERPQLKLYLSHEAFHVAVAGQVTDDNTTIWYAPGQPIRISPGYLAGLNHQRMRQGLAYELIKFMTDTRLHSPKALPVVMGIYERDSSGGEMYRIDFDRFAGTPLFSFTDLFQVGFADLPQNREKVFTSQSALLIELLGSKLSHAQMVDLVKGAQNPAAALAQAIGTTEAQFSAEYDAYVRKRITETSVLNLPAGRARIPVALTDAVTARAKAALAGDEVAFTATLGTATRADQLAWWGAAKTAGIKGYDVTVLDEETTGNLAKVYVYESITLVDGKTVSGIVIQSWALNGDKWLAGAVASPWPQGRR